jgi:hypothetical protein
MARSEHLPIYRASYDLCLHLEQGARLVTLPRAHAWHGVAQSGAPCSSPLAMLARLAAYRDAAVSVCTVSGKPCGNGTSAAA